MLKYSLCNPVAKAWKVYLRFSEAKPKKLKIIEEPKDVPKLIFD